MLGWHIIPRIVTINLSLDSGPAPLTLTRKKTRLDAGANGHAEYLSEAQASVLVMNTWRYVFSCGGNSQGAPITSGLLGHHSIRNEGDLPFFTCEDSVESSHESGPMRWLSSWVEPDS